MPSPPARNVNKALSELKSAEDLSLPQLAKILGFCESTVNSWFYGRRTPKGPQIKTIQERTARTKRPIVFNDFYPPAADPYAVDASQMSFV